MTNEEYTNQEDYIPEIGYTYSDLDLAFTTVYNKDDWKAPIDAFCMIGDQPLVREAIIFFTATEPTFEKIEGRENWLKVTAVGYREGPAGP